MHWLIYVVWAFMITDLIFAILLGWYGSLFNVIQWASLVLSFVGLFICAWCAWRGNWDKSEYPKWHWGRKWAWLWDNAEDGIAPRWYQDAHLNWHIDHCAFVWTAIRNPCNNLRFVPGVSKVGRPLYQKVWRQWYFHAGWNDRGWPVLSGGKTS